MSNNANSAAATITHDEVHVNIDKSSVKGSPAIVSQPEPFVISQPDHKRKPKNFVVTSCFVILLCNCIFGLLGYYFGGNVFKYFLEIVIVVFISPACSNISPIT